MRELTHDRAGPAFQMISKDVAYLKLSAVTNDDCVRYIRDAAGTKGLIVDIRNYPSNFVVFDLGGHFVARFNTRRAICDRFTGRSGGVS